MTTGARDPRRRAKSDIGTAPPASSHPKTPLSAELRFPADDSLFFKLIRVVNLTARPFSESIGRTNHMTLSEWRAMLVLANHPGAAASEVASRTGLDKMTVSRAIAGLDRHKRLIKREDPLDKRRTRLWLSASGQRLFERIGASASVRESQLFAGVSEADQALMSATLDRLIASLLTVDSVDSVDSGGADTGPAESEAE